MTKFVVDDGDDILETDLKDLKAELERGSVQNHDQEFSTAVLEDFQNGKDQQGQQKMVATGERSTGLNGMGENV
ncbi:hypothetical protein BGZ83_009633 [Gryganskiella cystojenkinii]|nr:hypothetical protein BGZ83_009633 [Gryganskiella cystojenkinii]